MTDGINRYIDLSNVGASEMMIPNQDQHSRWVDQDGILIFSLPPYSITQIVMIGDKTKWFYIDTGHDGHAIKTFAKAKMVLEQTIKWHQEAVLRQLEIAKEPKS